MQTVRPLSRRITPFLLSALLGCGTMAAACSSDPGDEGRSTSSTSALASPIDVPRVNVRVGLTTLFKGSRLQLTNTSAGTPLPDGTMSYFKAGDALAARGIADKPLDLPEHEEDLSAKVVTGQFFGNGGVLLVDKIKFDLNDLNVDLGDDTVDVTTDTDGIKFTLSMKSLDPTIKCYGNAWIPVLFLPIGWQDDGCPDTNMTDVTVTGTLMPFVNQSSQIDLNLVSVVFNSTMNGGTLGQGFEYFRDYQGELKAGFEARFGQFLSDPGFKSGVASALMGLVDSANGNQHVPSYASVTVDPNGLHATPGNVCVPSTCAGVGAECGIADLGCGVVQDCGGCSPGLACAAGGTPNRCGACPALSCNGACGILTNACGDTAQCGGCPSGQTCSAHRCRTCTPQCSGKRCGAADGCGGTCAGYCGSKLHCDIDPDTGAHLCQAQ